MQRASYDKMAITNRDRIYIENNSNVWKQIKTVRKTLRNAKQMVLMMFTSTDNY